MRFLVPQFIEVEDKLFGPLSFKQFVYMVGSLGFAGAMFALYGVFMAVLLGGPVVALGLALAFYRINDRPFIYVLQATVNYFIRRKLYLWKKDVKKAAAAAPVASEQMTRGYAPHISESRLKELAWSLDIKESMYEEGPRHPQSPLKSKR